MTSYFRTCPRLEAGLEIRARKVEMPLRSRQTRARDSCSDSSSPVRERRKRSASYGRDDLLDVNALKLSHSYHSKPPQDHRVVRTVVLHTLLFPLFISWWEKQLTRTQAYRWLGVYCSLWGLIVWYHVAYSRVFVDVCQRLQWSDALCTELQESLLVCAYMPLVLCTVLAIGYGRVVGATSNPKEDLERATSRYLMSMPSEHEDELAELSEDSDDEAEQLDSPAHDAASVDVSLATVDEDDLDERESEAWGFVLQEPIKVSIWNSRKQERTARRTFYQLRAELADRSNIIKDDTPVDSQVVWPGSALSAIAPWLVVAYLAYLQLFASTDQSLNQAPETKLPGETWLSSLQTMHAAFGWTTLQWLGLGVFLTVCGGIIVFTSSVILSSMAYAEVIYQRRFYYAKYFAALASSRKAKAYGLPHFALKNVPSIKVWLALRAGRTWLRKHRSQRIADAVASSTFMFVLMLFVLLSVLVIRKEGSFMRESVHGSLMCWCVMSCHFLQRYLRLSSKIEKKYNDHSILLTEQINLQLRILQVSAQIREETAALKLQQQQPQPQMQQQQQLVHDALRHSALDGDTEPESESVDLESDFLDDSTAHQPQRQQRPTSASDENDKLDLLILKKERLQVANTVLKLALKLLKELDSPAKAQVLMSPAMYNIARVLIFSVLSAFFSEMLGFKLKLWKLLKVK